MDALDVALFVGRAIDAAGGTYFVGGSLASSLQGEPRATNDIDIVIDLPLGRVDTLIAELGPDFEVDREMLFQALRTAGSCNIFYLPTVFKVDLFAVGLAPFDEMEFSRKRAAQVRMTGETLVVKSPEDSILRKLWWYRLGNEVSDRQWRDVVQILVVNGIHLDASYLENWSRHLKVADLLARARDAAKEVTGK